MTELTKVEKLETVTKTFSTTIEWEQELSHLIPDIGADQIISSALFRDKLALEVQWEVSAGYMITHITTWNILVSRDWTVSIVLGEPEIFWVVLTWTNKTTELGIVTPSEIDMENKLREKARDIIWQEALSGNILKEAKNNAQNVLQTLLLNANIQIKEVIIKGTGDLQQ